MKDLFDVCKLHETKENTITVGINLEKILIITQNLRKRMIPKLRKRMKFSANLIYDKTNDNFQRKVISFSKTLGSGGGVGGKPAFIRLKNLLKKDLL